MTPIRILELRSVRGTGGGPEKTILQGTARSDPQRFAITVCYVRDLRDSVFGIDHKAAALPIEYVELRERNSFDPSIYPALRRLVEERRIDIVHAHDYKTNVMAAWLMKWHGVTAMSTVHGWTGHSWRERYLYYPVDKHVLRVFPAVVAVSEDIRGELLRHGARPERVRTVLNAIDHRAFVRDRSREAAVRANLGIEDGAIVIGSIGRLEPQKRFDLLIDAFARLRSVHPELRLLIAGDGSQRAALSAQIAQYNLQCVCRLIGHRSDIVDLHHGFDVYVQSSDYEGTPNAVLEAMALETPIIATDVGGTAQLVEHGKDGLIIPASNPDALIAAVRSVIENPDAAAARAAAARRRVETDLSFDVRMSKVEAIYEELAGGAGRSRTKLVPVGT